LLLSFPHLITPSMTPWAIRDDEGGGSLDLEIILIGDASRDIPWVALEPRTLTYSV